VTHTAVGRIPSAGAALLLATLAGCDSGCANTVLSDAASPDGRRHAVVFERDCGATTGFSTQVSVLPAGRSPSGGGNVFVAEGGHGRAAPGPGGGPRVAVRWLGRRTLEVRFDGRARVLTRDARHDETDVRFVADST
jgi:hypothetical protein